MKKLFLFSATILLAQSLHSQSIKGRITDLYTGAPVAGSSAYVKDHKAVIADNNGQFELKLNAAGKYSLRLGHIEYNNVNREVEVGANEQVYINIALIPKQQLLEPVSISALRANENTPVANSRMNSAEIAKRNEGRDIPFILKDLPSTFSYSDAGAGVGYTGMRIRGSDISRINVTINGIPLNDPEGHGVFWVNTPDLASSARSIEVQRGAGTSTNGAGAFGASVNINTSKINTGAYAKSSFSAGSFNTLKTNINVGSGLLNNHWSIDARLSKITSDGFIDRASSDLRSYYLSGNYYSEKTSVQFIHFAGTEQTYQAWSGVPEAKLNDDADGIQAFIARNGLSPAAAQNLINSDPRTYNTYTYENEVDDYAQDHYQLHFSHRINELLKVNAALHYTWGRGFFEQYRNDDDLADYALPDVISGTDTITSTDLIRRRWLDNDFIGGTYTIEFRKDELSIDLGGAYNEYKGDHFGELTWMRFASNSEVRDRYYDNRSLKTDLNTYLKAQYNFGEISVFGDLQYRVVSYVGRGIDNDLRPVSIDADFGFFNPKAGINYVKGSNRAYLSAGVAQREPVRNDFLDAIPGNEPKSEFMIDYEAGYEFRNNNLSVSAGLYLMDYKDQLVLTGELNDVGSAIRINVPNSMRMGIELTTAYRLTEKLILNGNLNVSRNTISDFESYTQASDASFNVIGYDTLRLSSTDISFSPNVIGGIGFNYSPFKNFTVDWTTQFVGSQFMDNTSNAERSLDAFSTTDLRLNYSMKTNYGSGIEFFFLVANLFDEEYEPNGYTYGYIVDGTRTTENFFFPMAGINFMGGITIHLDRPQKSRWP